MMKKTNEKEWLTPSQMAQRTGVNLDTLRYYEREGLIQPIQRAQSGHRRYSGDDVLWIEVLRCLRDTGMTIEQLRNYCDLGEQGDHTQPQRLKLLLEHRKIVQAQIDNLHESLKMVDHKINFYKEAIKGATTQ